MTCQASVSSVRPTNKNSTIYLPGWSQRSLDIISKACAPCPPYRHLPLKKRPWPSFTPHKTAQTTVHSRRQGLIKFHEDCYAPQMSHQRRDPRQVRVRLIKLPSHRHEALRLRIQATMSRAHSTSTLPPPLGSPPSASSTFPKHARPFHPVDRLLVQTGHHWRMSSSDARYAGLNQNREPAHTGVLCSAATRSNPTRLAIFAIRRMF